MEDREVKRSWRLVIPFQEFGGQAKRLQNGAELERNAQLTPVELVGHVGNIWATIPVRDGKCFYGWNATNAY